MINSIISKFKDSSNNERNLLNLNFFCLSLFLLDIGFEVNPTITIIHYISNFCYLSLFGFYQIKLAKRENLQLTHFFKKHKLSVSILLISTLLVLYQFVVIPSNDFALFITQIGSDQFIIRQIYLSQVLIFLTLLSGYFSIIHHLLSLKISPAKMFSLSFILLILVGTFLLMLPKSTTSSIDFIDALFTATSASCVTGLITLDTATDFTRSGQVIILFLIQIGGLGILTLTAFFIQFSGNRSNLKQKLLFKEILQSDNFSNVNRFLLRIIITTLTIEAIGALIMAINWYVIKSSTIDYFEIIFFSISSFCNAGFSIYSDSFMSHHSDWISLLTISSLIILGGLNPSTISELKKYIFLTKKEKRMFRFSLQSKLVLKLNFFLIFLGTGLFLLFEYSNTLESFHLIDKIKHSLFQSIVTRTAGFNSIDFSAIGHITTLWMIAFMFIGAGTGSTAGGVKLNTVAVISLWVKSLLKGEKQCVYEGRAIGLNAFHRSILVLILSAVIIFTSTLLLTSIEENFKFIDLLFEVVSAFATVGLSKGLTAELSSQGKLVIISTMFIGRIGVVSFALSLMKDGKEEQHLRYPEESIMIG
jgi:trk system potassium uptake protein